MAKKLFEMSIFDSKSAAFFQKDFSSVLDSHLEYLKTAGQTRVENVDVRYIGQYIGDFYAVLSDLKIAPKYHRIVMLLNGFTNPINYDGKLRQIFIPDTTEIDSLLQIYNTARSKIVLQEGQ